MDTKKPQPKLSEATDVAACICANLRKTTRVVTQAYNNSLRAVSLTATQFNLLASLDSSGGMPLTQLAETLVVDRTTLTRNLKPLLRRDLIRTEQKEDQRIRNVILTDAGMRLYKSALPLWEQVQLQITQNLGQERWSGFMDDMAATVLAVQGKA